MEKIHINNYNFDQENKLLTIDFILNDEEYVGKEVYIDLYSILTGKIEGVKDFKEKIFAEKIVLKYKNKVVFNLSKLKYVNNYDGINFSISHKIVIVYEGGILDKKLLISDIIIKDNKIINNIGKEKKFKDSIKYGKVLGLIPINLKNLFYILLFLSITFTLYFFQNGPLFDLGNKYYELIFYIIFPFLYILFIYEYHSHTYIKFPKFDKKIIIDDKVNILEFFNGVPKIILENYEIEISLLNNEKFIFIESLNRSRSRIQFKNEYVNKISIYKKYYDYKFKGNKLFTNEKLEIDRDFINSKICETNMLNELDLFEDQGVTQYVEFRFKNNDYNDLVRRYKLV